MTNTTEELSSRALAAQLEQRLTYPLDDRFPEPGHGIEVATGVFWVRMPLPFALNHINVWLLRDEIDGVQGWTIVDCCIDKPETRALWEQVFVNVMQGMPVLRVIVTHMHPDHIGLAHWLCDRFGVRMWISSTDFTVARLASQAPSSFGGSPAAAFFALHGWVDAEAQSKLKDRSSYFASLVPTVPNSHRRMMEGDSFMIGRRRWQCISGYGHAPEHIALYSESIDSGEKSAILLGGDMMLPRISTNVSVYDNEPEANALQLFLDSIDKFKSCNTQTLALPSHGKPFVGVHERVQQLHTHHQERLTEVFEACQIKACSAYDVLPVMFKRPLDLHQTTFAMGEIVAHLHFLWFAGRIKRTLGLDQIYRFSAV
ncbi:MAG TPA: MBL fold metallo-hydrolase [Burkholderiaceae bacterium]|nr:MBL fold metallo-hydrolase [Burkholderiaceae bacterium]